MKIKCEKCKDSKKLTIKSGPIAIECDCGCVGIGRRAKAIREAFAALSEQSEEEIYRAYERINNACKKEVPIFDEEYDMRWLIDYYED